MTTADHHALAYRYALLRPLDWDVDCDAELRKANGLWNKLVEIEHAHREKVRAVAAAESEVAALKAAYDMARTERDALIDCRKAAWADACKRVATPDLDEQIAVVRERLKTVAATLREATQRAYRGHHDALAALDQERQVAVKTARQNSALHWGTYNSVVQSYEVGRQRALMTKAEMRLRSFDGTGRITQQIINGMTVVELHDGSKSQVRLGPDPKGKSGKIRALTMTVYTRDRQPRHVTWPIVWHRELPEDARIQQVSVHKTGRGGRTMWHAVFSLRLPGTIAPRTRGRVVAINPGWRRTTPGVRVATVAIEGRKGIDHVFLPDAVVQRLERNDQDTAERDAAISRTLEWLRKLDLEVAPPAVAEAVRNTVRAPRPGPRALYRLLRIWRAEPRWRLAALAQLAEWHAADKIIWHDREERRAWALARRREHYRLEARRLLGDARAVVINEHDMSETAKATDNGLPAPARAMRVVAAPGEFRAAVVEYANKAGIAVAVRALANDRCAQCGAPFVTNDRSMAVWRCRSGHVADQDENYVRLLLATPVETARKQEKPEISMSSGAGRWARLKARRAAREQQADGSQDGRQGIADAAQRGYPVEIS